MKYFSNKRYLKLLHKIGLTLDDRVCMTSLLYVVYKTSFLCESVWLLYVNPLEGSSFIYGLTCVAGSSFIWVNMCVDK